MHRDSCDASNPTAPGAFNKHGPAETVRILLKAGSRIDAEDDAKFQPLHTATKSANVSAICDLIAAGADVSAHDKDNWTPLHEFAIREQQCSAEAVQTILKAGAKIDAVTHSKLQPLNFAPKSGNVNAITELVAAGADVDARTPRSDDWTLLHHARFWGQPAAIEALLKNGAKPLKSCRVLQQLRLISLQALDSTGFRGEVDAATRRQRFTL